MLILFKYIMHILIKKVSCCRALNITYFKNKIKTNYIMTQHRHTYYLAISSIRLNLKKYNSINVEQLTLR